MSISRDAEIYHRKWEEEFYGMALGGSSLSDPEAEVRLASVLKALSLLRPDKMPDPRKTYSTAEGSAYSAGYNAAMAEVAAIARAALPTPFAGSGGEKS